MTEPDMVCRLFGLALESITDGPGIRFAVFAQGCPHFCQGCHNPESHDFRGGYEYDVEDLIRLILADPLLDGVTFSGGEPFMQAEEFACIARAVRSRKRNIICYSGYTWEELLEQADTRPGWHELLSLTDILIDGRYDNDQKSMDLRFRGSRNQRAIDVQASLINGQVTLYNL